MTPDDLIRFGKKIEVMYFANGREVPDTARIRAYWETLQDLTWDEFEAGLFNARQASGAGFMPNDGVIHEEGLKVRAFIEERYARAQRALALAPVAQPDWSDTPPATVAELVESYGAAAELSRVNFKRAKADIENHRPGDPGLGELLRRKDQHLHEYHAHKKLQAQYEALLATGQKEQPPAGEWFDKLAEAEKDELKERRRRRANG